MSVAASNSAPRHSMKPAVATNAIELRHPKAKPQHHPKPKLHQMLYLRVNWKFLLPLPAPTEHQPNPEPLESPLATTGNLNVITADVLELPPFAGRTVYWLIKVARFFSSQWAPAHSIHLLTSHSNGGWIGIWI